MKPIKKYIEEQIEPNLPEGVTIEYGGLTALTRELLPGLIMTVAAAMLVLLVLLVYHFKKISISILSLAVSFLCLFGANLGLWIFDLHFSVTAILGVISLITKTHAKPLIKLDCVVCVLSSLLPLQPRSVSCR